jgi:hypothetical protein
LAAKDDPDYPANPSREALHRIETVRPTFNKAACMIRSQALLLKGQPMAHEDYGMCAGKKVALLLLTLLLLLFSVAANAQTCVIVGYDNSTEAIVSGRITTHHKLPKDSEGRTGDGPWLILDQPLLAGGPSTGEPSYGFCSKYRKMAILPGGEKTEEEADAQITQIRKWNNQHVTIDGKLGRFGSGLVSPNVYIKITTIKKD